jgi:hypothetical protein
MLPEGTDRPQFVRSFWGGFFFLYVMGIIQYFDTSRGLIKDNIRNDSRMKAIALFYKLKFKYSNSKIYRYCPQKISNDTGVSSYLSNKLVNIMIDMAIAEIITQYDKLAKEQITVLSLKSIQKIKLKYLDFNKSLILINENESLKDIVFRLKSICVENYLRQQKYVINCKVDQKLLDQEGYSAPIKHIKRVGKIAKRSGEELSKETVLSSRKAFHKFGINPCDFIAFKEFTFENFGWNWNSDRVKSVPCQYEKFEYCKFKPNQRGYIYWYKGRLVQELPSSVIVSYL